MNLFVVLTLYNKWRGLMKKIESRICVWNFCESSVWKVQRKIQRDITINVHWLSRKVPVILVTVWSDMNFLDRSSKIPQILYFMSVRPFEQSCSKRTDRHYAVYVTVSNVSNGHNRAVTQCFSTARPRPCTGPWHQLYRAASGSSGIGN